MMHDSESNENKDAWFSARVWDLVITGGIQGENRPENQDTSHPPENCPTPICHLHHTPQKSEVFTIFSRVIGGHIMVSNYSLGA
jgi:hypothetical protein